MDAHDTEPCSSIESVLEADRWARSHAGLLAGAEKSEAPFSL